jgi:glutamate-1-semialdehyde 2,1-aminomutase
MFTWFFREGTVRNFADAAASDTALFAAFHRAMLERGVWLPPSQFEAAFLGTAHSDAVVETTVRAAREALGAMAAKQGG